MLKTNTDNIGLKSAKGQSAPACEIAIGKIKELFHSLRL